MHQVQAYEKPTPAEFEDSIFACGRPAVLRGIAVDWPVVRAALQSPEHAIKSLSENATDTAIEVMRTDPENEGRFHYTSDNLRLNFVRGRTDLRTFLRALQEQASADRPFTMAAMGVPAAQVVLGFQASHPMPFVPRDAAPRLWIGNAAKVATHNDPTDNIAVVAAGSRRFTLFPPEQISNLYLGPLHFTPAGTPVSMVHVTAPDFDRYPRFERALETAQLAELGPGDAIFIPYGWYHHVEALDRFNLLVNYWWNPARIDTGSPWDAMLHGLLSISNLPDVQRRAWRAMFEHYVFRTAGDPAAHIPPELAGVLGPMRDEKIAQMKAALVDSLNSDMEKSRS